MSVDFENAVIPYTKEIPVDYKATVHSFFISSYSPYEFTNWIEECMSWKTGCMIGDWSDLFKAELEGPEVIEFIRSISGMSAKNFPIGKGKHITCCNKRGKVIGEGILLRLNEDRYRISGGPNLVKWVEFCLLKSNDRFHVKFTDVSNNLFVYQIQGPTSVEILEDIIGESLREIPYMHFKNVSIADTQVLALRQGMSGNIGFELQGASEKGVDIYNKIMEAGEKHGKVTKVGNLAKGVNHVEACFPTGSWDYTPAIFDPDDNFCQEFLQFIGPIGWFLAGALSRKGAGSYEGGAMDAFFSPVELGWGYSLCFDHEFPGSDVLKEEKEHPRRKICTLVWNSEDIADVEASYYRDGEPFKAFVMPRDYEIAPDKVFKDGKLVGTSMSRAYSIYFRQMISLCVIDTELLREGTEVEISWGYHGHIQKMIRAKVAPVPYYNPDKKRNL